MFSTTSAILFGVIVLVAVVVIWKWWKNPSASDNSNTSDLSKTITNESSPVSSDTVSSDTALVTSEPPPMLFAVNDSGNLDLTDMNGKILNSSYGANPKVYINLLDRAETDVIKVESDTGNVSFRSNVGNTKLYEVAGKSYIINYTRL
jgi:hypothetical protein